MRIATRLAVFSLVVLSLSSLAIKFYFLPATERFIRMSVEEQVHRDMEAFEKIIAVVVTAAGTDKDFVRRALHAISVDKGIPIELRRGEFLHKQFGRRSDKEARNDFEARALLTGKPEFRETERFIEYAYPLKAQGVCQGCHVDSSGRPIERGTPVGLAVRRVPLTALSESPIGYFTLDLFWENFALVLLAILISLIPVYFWVLRPLQRLSAESGEILKAGEREEPIDPNEKSDDWSAIRKVIENAKHSQ